MEIHWTSILAEGRLWQSLLLKLSIYDTSGVLALAGHDRRAPISDEVVVEYKRFPDSASMVTYTKNVQYCQNDGPRLCEEQWREHEESKQLDSGRGVNNSLAAKTDMLI